MFVLYRFLSLIGGISLELKYIDIGLNLINKQYKYDRDLIVSNSYNDGIGIIITGTDKKSNLDALYLCEDYSAYPIFCTCGIHPHNANDWNDGYKRIIIEQLECGQNYIKAIGEIGLDYDRMYSTKENQLKCFDDMLYIAEEYNLPLFLHERDEVNDFIKILKNHRVLCKKAVVHCFTGTKETALKYLNLGCYIGITGWICDNRRNKDLLEAIKVIPLERLMIETDGPYLTPVGRGLERRNIPNNIVYVADEIAKLKGVSIEKVQEICLNNTIKFFNI